MLLYRCFAVLVLLGLVSNTPIFASQTCESIKSSWLKEFQKNATNIRNDRKTRADIGKRLDQLDMTCPRQSLELEIFLRDNYGVHYATKVTTPYGFKYVEGETARKNKTTTQLKKMKQAKPINDEVPSEEAFQDDSFSL